MRPRLRHHDLHGGGLAPLGRQCGALRRRHRRRTRTARCSRRREGRLAPRVRVPASRPLGGIPRTAPAGEIGNRPPALRRARGRARGLPQAPSRVDGGGGWGPFLRGARRGVSRRRLGPEAAGHARPACRQRAAARSHDRGRGVRAARPHRRPLPVVAGRRGAAARRGVQRRSVQRQDPQDGRGALRPPGAGWQTLPDRARLRSVAASRLSHRQRLRSGPRGARPMARQDPGLPLRQRPRGQGFHQGRRRVPGRARPAGRPGAGQPGRPRRAEPQRSAAPVARHPGGDEGPRAHLARQPASSSSPSRQSRSSMPRPAASSWSMRRVSSRSKPASGTARAASRRGG